MQAVRIGLLGLALGSLILAAMLAGCGKSSSPSSAATSSAETPAAGGESPTPTPATPVTSRAKATPQPPPVDPVVVLKTSAGDIQIQLFADKAPRTVDNFLHNYVERGFYNGTVFHHADPESMVIAGGFAADKTPKETRAPVYNESQNGLRNTRGMVALIRDASHAHSGTSQFFINTADNGTFDFESDETDEAWGYCVFGKVIAGMDVVEQIAQAEVEEQGDFARFPRQAIVINEVEKLR
ncbi:MAG: peptidylprolyl isomerase [Pirellulaceae bacterium]|jgi:cyclophilin family peptidyl-prolyl cis-trans isomerase|nr:peptidylprolyl isomerase [Pirellulaceae bacterium]